MNEDLSQLLSSLHPLERKVLLVLKGQPARWDHELIAGSSLNESQLSMAAGWMLTKGIIRIEEEKKSAHLTITDLGRRYAEGGIPEKKILKRLAAGERVAVGELASLEGMDPLEVSTAIGNLKTSQMVKVGNGGVLELQKEDFPPLVDPVLETLLKRLSESGEPQDTHSLSAPEADLLKEVLDKQWKTRGVVRTHERTSRRIALTDLGVTLVERLAPEAGEGEEVTQLSPDLLKDGTWRGKLFRKYNISLRPSRTASGFKHPYREFLDRVKMKLISMGFQEMRGPLVETEFWNSDALFMPQFHPARDIHDVYFVDRPRSAKALPHPFASRVAETHEMGWETGSKGWRYSFDRDRAKRLVLRSQGTAVSARKLAEGPKIPGKYFSIARCFRYDLVDATHAPDFFQVEGIALGDKITFRTLLGLLKLFASEMAQAAEVRYLPAYFPYTEPSVEMHVKHPKLGWMELGGAGLFRPEVVLPLGVRVPVIAWGLGLDRMAMVALGIQDIRDLFSSDLDVIRTRREKEL